MRIAISSLVLAAALAGCQTAEDMQAAQRARLDGYMGLTMAEFSAKTGLTPAEMTPTASGRLFTVIGPTVTMATSGAYGVPVVSNTSTCRILLDTVKMTATGTASDWRIVGVTTNGPCADVI